MLVAVFLVVVFIIVVVLVFMLAVIIVILSTFEVIIVGRMILPFIRILFCLLISLLLPPSTSRGHSSFLDVIVII